MKLHSWEALHVNRTCSYNSAMQRDCDYRLSTLNWMSWFKAAWHWKHPVDWYPLTPEHLNISPPGSVKIGQQALWPLQAQSPVTGPTFQERSREVTVHQAWGQAEDQRSGSTQHWMKWIWRKEGLTKPCRSRFLRKLPIQFSKDFNWMLPIYIRSDRH